MEYDAAVPLLEAIAMAEVSGASLDLEALAAELDVSPAVVENGLEWIDEHGLAFTGLDELPPGLRRAGRQYLAVRGKVAHDVLRFLPRTIDDLHARAALLRGGTVLVDELRYAVLHDRAVDHASDIVPAAFSPAVDEALALNLFAATVALMARLSAGEPAGCVAEEILAVKLMAEAETWLELESERGTLDYAATVAAKGELRSLFELFQDDDVLNMFGMEEPGDAALAGHSWIYQQLGVADQRIEAWFKPFSWTIATGHLDERPH
jgi:hypothetical protein